MEWWKIMGIKLILLIFCPSSLAQQDRFAVNDLIRADTDLVGPGVLARLTPGGTSYVSAFVARALANELLTTRAPDEINSTMLESLSTVRLSGLRLNLFQLPAQFNVAPLQPNVVSVNLKQMSISVGAYGSGRIDSVTVDTPMDIKTAYFSMEVAIRVNRNNRGNPHLQVEKCRVPPKMPVTVAVVKALTPETGAKLANAMAEDGHTVFEQLICPRLIHLVENRINQRFTLLPTRITLGDTHNYDLVKSILSTNNIIRRDSPVSSRPTLPARTLMRNHPTTPKRSPVPLHQNRHLVQRQSPILSRTQSQIRQLHLGATEMRRIKQRLLFRRQAAAHMRLHVRSPRVKRQGDFHTFLNQFNLSRADSLILDYGMTGPPSISARGIELSQVGEITAAGSRTPFGPRPLALPPIPSSDMLQIVVSDFVPNTLMFHGHRVGLFNTRVDANTPQFGPVMRTSCDLSTGSLFCVGDLFPTLREMVPDKGVAFLFSTLKAPAVAVHPESAGGIKFRLQGLIEILAMDGAVETRIGAMEIHIDATMKMKLSSKSVRGKVNLEDIKLISRTPRILVQEELDDAGFLSREILQRMVNDILKQGIPIPVHPLFKLQKPKLTLMNRAMLLETNFQLNDKLIRQLTSEHLVI